MTRLLSKFTESIAGRIENGEAVKNMVVLSPTEFIVRGFLFERTTTKNAYYLWRLIVPLFAPVMPGIVLNYSNRISLDSRTEAYIRIDENNEELLQRISEALRFEQVPKLNRINSVQSFLSEFESSGMDWRPNTKLDLAFARLLCGDFARGGRMIDEILQLSLDSPIAPIVQAEARRLADASRRGTNSLLEIANEIKMRNVNALFPGITLKND